MSTGFAFKQRLHLCSVSNLSIVLVLQLQNFKVGFSGPKTFRGAFENRAPGLSDIRLAPSTWGSLVPLQPRNAPES